MTALRQHITTFSLLGDFINQFTSGPRSDNRELDSVNASHYDTFRTLIKEVHIHNPWFTEEFVLEALEGIVFMLKKENLEKWLSGYPELAVRNRTSKKGGIIKDIGVIMAGNIPLVGFHDLLCVLLSENRLIAKPSSKDQHLIKAVSEILLTIEPGLTDRITMLEERLPKIDAIIATGSNNTSRYFDYYFKDTPKIIRKNRNSVAVLTGEETDTQLSELGKDIFTFFGLGCRNVTKLYIPEDFDLVRMLRIFESYSYLYDHNKYGNNIDYYRTIYLMNKIPFLDNGAILVREDPGLSSPVGVVFYEKYSEIEAVKQVIEENSELLQCVVSVRKITDETLAPGTAQRPLPWDYADGVDTLRFLTDI